MNDVPAPLAGLLAALDEVHATAGRLGSGTGTPAALINAVHATLAAISTLPPQAPASVVRDGAAALARVRRDLHQRHAAAGRGLDALGLTQVLAGPRSAGLRDRG